MIKCTKRDWKIDQELKLKTKFTERSTALIRPPIITSSK